MIFTLIKNEFIKLMSRKKTLVVMIAFILLVIAMGYGTYKNNDNAKKWNSPEYKIQNEQMSIENLKQMKNNPKISEEDKKNFEKNIQECIQRIKDIKLQVKGNKKDWKSEIKENIKSYEEELKDKNLKENDRENIKRDLQKQKYLLVNNIEPEEGKFEVKATTFILELVSMLGSIFLTVGVVMFGADMVSGEYTPPTMKFLLTEPVSRGKILFSKFVALVLSSTVIILAIEIIAFIIMGIIFKFGNMNYPMEVGTKYVYDLVARGENGQRLLNVVAGSTHIIPMWKYIVEMFLLQGLFIIVATSFTFLLSTILKSSMVSMSVSIVVIIIFNVAQVMPFTRKFSYYLFNSYGDPSGILNGGLAGLYNNPNITLGFSITLLVVWTIICYIISHIVFKKKDILI